MGMKKMNFLKNMEFLTSLTQIKVTIWTPVENIYQSNPLFVIQVHTAIYTVGIFFTTKKEKKINATIGSVMTEK